MSERDRTMLGQLWAKAVAEVDEMEEALKYARNREHAAWEALESSRAQTVKPPPRLVEGNRKLPANSTRRGGRR